MASDSEDTEFLSRVDRLERNQDRLAREIEQLQRELRALGVRLPRVNPAGRTPLSPEARLSQLRRAAARARSAKTVGPGVGQVNDPETLERLRQQAQRLRQQTPDAEEEDL